MFDIVTSSTARGAGQVATQAFAEGELVHRIIDYGITEVPSYQSIQIGATTHLEDLGVIAYLNHSCRPSTIVDTEALEVRATRAIEPGDELTFFYPSTEWDMDRPFDCLCADSSCIGNVAGAKYLPLETLNDYFLNPHIQQLLSQSPLHRG